MTKKPRRSLDATLAEKFVFGSPATESVESESIVPPPVPKQSQSKETTVPKTTTTPKQSKLMEKLMTAEKEATVRITVDLPKSMHQQLSILAAKTGRKKADIIRTLLGEVLEEIE
jgi:heme-binding NEAT domain protein